MIYCSRRLRVKCQKSETWKYMKMVYKLYSIATGFTGICIVAGTWYMYWDSFVSLQNVTGGGDEQKPQVIQNGPVTNAATPSLTDVGTCCILLGYK